MTRQAVELTQDDAERIHDLLAAFETILRDALPQRLYDRLYELPETDLSDVRGALRYGIPQGPEYLAEHVRECRTAILRHIEAKGWQTS